MGMCVSITGLTVSGPPCVANACMGMKFLTNNGILEFGYSTLFLKYSQSRTVLQSHTGAVIATVLQPFESFNDNWIGLPGSGITNDSTHKDKRISAPKI